MNWINSREFAMSQDQNDPLCDLRNEFLFPAHNGHPVVYFTGNSLGLQPKSAKRYLLEELDDWARLGVEGHFHAKRPWMPYHEFFTDSLARLCGALPEEVVAMGTLTNNLHLLMVSFYRPKGKRFKILCEKKAFPSDQYALQSQARFHGYDPKEAIIEVGPREGEHTFRTEDFLEVIERQGDEIAMLMIGGVNYYTGQFMNIPTITSAARSKGIMVGWDLAHAMGNVPLQLHDWDVDFAAWCSYKYMNSGPGSVAGIYVHQRHLNREDIPRFEGWWGHDKDTRFKMPETFKPMATAEAWQLSNAPVMAMAPHRASLDLFDSTKPEERRKKSLNLSAYLRFIITEVAERRNSPIEVITPQDDRERGSQLSVIMHGQGKELFDALMDHGVIVDWREPNVIRMAPVPLYNSFEDIFRFGEILDKCLSR
ncbi:MAG: kynureninase [Bacteroidota bacterium]|nr:kynureninase [Bacteroidota bacterium]